jgi:streptogramin lyase
MHGGVATNAPAHDHPWHVFAVEYERIRGEPYRPPLVRPATNGITLFPLTDIGLEGIAASPDGSVWFTQTTKGNIARITNDGVISESKVVKGSQPFGITADAEGDPWYTMMSANRIGEFQLRLTWREAARVTRGRPSHRMRGRGRSAAPARCRIARAMR